MSPHNLRGAVATADRQGLDKVRGTTKNAQSGGVAGTLESVQNGVFKLWNVEFLAPLVIGPVAWVAGKSVGLFKGTEAAKAANAWVSGVVRAPIEGVRNTTLGTAGELRANVAKAFSTNAANAGADDVAASARLKAEQWKAVDTARVAPAVQRVDNAGAQAAARMAGNTALEKPMGRIVDWRLAQLEKRAAKQAGKLVQSHEYVVPGLMQRVLRFVGLGKELERIPVLSVAHGSYEAAQKVMAGGYDARATAASMKSVVEGLTPEALEHLGEAAQVQAGHVAQHTQALGQTLETIEHWKGLRQSGMGGVAPMLVAGIKRVPLMTAVIGVGMAAGTAAVWMRTRERTKLGQSQLRDLAGDVYGVPAAQVTQAMLEGANVPPLLKHAKASLSHEHRSDLFSAVMHTGANGLLVAANGMAGMGAQIGMEMMADVFRSENPYLSAYGMLKDAEVGKGTIEPKQREQLVKMLVATAPDIEAHGGVRNALVAPIASQMVKENLSVRQILQEIGKPELIAQRAVKVKEAAAAAKVAEVPKAEVPTVKVAANMNAAPTNIGSIEHQGRVAQQAVAKAHG